MVELTTGQVGRMDARARCGNSSFQSVIIAVLGRGYGHNTCGSVVATCASFGVVLKRLAQTGHTLFLFKDFMLTCSTVWSVNSKIFPKFQWT